MSVCVFFKVRSQLCACCSTPSPNFACMHVVFSLLYHVSVWRHGWARRRRTWCWMNAINHGSGPRPGPSATSFSYAPTAARCSSPACLKAWRGKDENVHASKTGRRAAGSHARTARRTWEPTVAAPGGEWANTPSFVVKSSRDTMYTRPAGWLPLTSYSECYCLLECNLT